MLAMLPKWWNEKFPGLHVHHIERSGVTQTQFVVSVNSKYNGLKIIPNTVKSVEKETAYKELML